MKTIVYAILSMFLYAVANLILEYKLSRINNLTIIVCYSAIVFGLAILSRQITKTNDPSFDFPTGNLLWFTLILGIIFTLADYFYIGAYTNGGSVIAVSAIIALFPAVSSGLKFILTKEIPNIWQIAGYVLIFIGIIMIAKGAAIIRIK